jgi:hypothetical protein
MADNKPNREGEREPPVIDRRAWIFGILEAHKYSKTTLEVAGAIGWKFFKRETGETKVKAQTIADHLGVTLSAVNKACWLLKNDGWIESTARAAPGRATTYRLTFAPQQPAAKTVAPQQHRGGGKGARQTTKPAPKPAEKVRYAGEDIDEPPF